MTVESFDSSIPTLDELIALRAKIDEAIQVITEPRLEKLWSFKELEAAGYGNRSTLTKMVRSGELRAVRVHGAFKVFEQDLAALREPVAP